MVRNWQRLLSDTDNRNNSRGGQDGKSFQDIESAKHVTGEERRLHLSDAISPAASMTIARNIALKSLVCQRTGSGFFKILLGANAIPAVVKICEC